MFKTIISIILWPIGLTTFFLFAVFYILLTYFIHPTKLYPVVKIACRLMLLSIGQWLKVEGTPPDKRGQPYLYLFNHESMIDPFMFGGAINHYFTAVGAHFQFSYPVWGWLVRRHGAIPIKRKQIDQAIHSLDYAEEAIQKGISFLISPEGTRTLTGELGQFKKGPFHVALNTGVTLVPVALFGAYNAKKKMDWRLNPGILTIKFGDPITREEYGGMDLNLLKDTVRNRVKTLINQH